MNKKDNKSLTKTNKKTEKKERKIKKFFSKLFQILKTKWLVKASTTVLLVLIVFGIYWGGTELLEKVNIPNIDCTKDKIYSLSEETKNRIKDIDKEIKITLINYESSDSMQDIMDQYKSINKKIEIEEIDDISTRIDLQQKYSIDSTDSLILVSCGDSEIEITSSDLYSYNYTTGEEVDLTEESVTNAIINVTTEQKPKAYFIENHTMYTPSLYYTNEMSILMGDANEVGTVNLLSTGKVPEDCDTLIITTLKEDFTEIEKDYIVEYINNGGKLMILSGSNAQAYADLSNFNKILEIYGIKIKDGIILEGDTNKMVYQYPNIIIEDVGYSSITKYKDLNLNIVLANAGAIEVSENAEDIQVEYETIAQTSEEAFLRTDLSISTTERTKSDSEREAFTVGVIATKKIDEEKTSKLVMYSYEMFTELQIQNYIISAGNNNDVIANSVAYLNEKENSITIRKNYDTVTYTVTESQHNIIMKIIYIIPVAMITAGIVIWQVRRRKR